MSMDKTFDLVRAGHKVRCLTMPFSIDGRELAQKSETMTFTGRTVQEAQAKADAYMKGLVTIVNNEVTRMSGLNQRLTALERDERRPGSGLPYPATTTLQDINDGYYQPVIDQRKRNNFDSEPGEFYCKTDRNRGATRGDR